MGSVSLEALQKTKLNHETGVSRRATYERILQNVDLPSKETSNRIDSTTSVGKPVRGIDREDISR